MLNDFKTLKKFSALKVITHKLKEIKITLCVYPPPRTGVVTVNFVTNLYFDFIYGRFRKYLKKKTVINIA